ncbi:MurR/RpiR family transcriptional regulator [Vagococcus acidifermentans]|uniref:SIS domain-containing protein n=1 Tax=Vagococcus acidifermentans TaxID=564710 RepID=A0A430AZ33_9ENTE|nr:SIS domain-containing protein [Vagococcus acidifermentans]RSU13323.1 hypothetical protein CBF27_03850 [Vagococcus acidifermentans]
MHEIYHLERLFPNIDLSDSEKNILAVIIETLQKNESTSIKDVSQKAFTSPSTISKLAKKTDHNYSELLYFLRQSLHSKENNTVDGLPYLSLTEPYESAVHKIAAYLAEYRSYTYGEGFCRFISGYFHKKMLLLKHYTIDLDMVELKLVHADKQAPLVFIFSKSGETRACLRKMAETHELSGKVIGFTASEHSTLYQKSDIAFCVEDLSYGNQANNLRTFFYGNTLNLIEVLLSDCFK